MEDNRFSMSAPFIPVIITTARRYLRDTLQIENGHLAQCLAEYCIFYGINIMNTELVLTDETGPGSEYHFLGYQIERGTRIGKTLFVREKGNEDV